MCGDLLKHLLFLSSTEMQVIKHKSNGQVLLSLVRVTLCLLQSLALGMLCLWSLLRRVTLYWYIQFCQGYINLLEHHMQETKNLLCIFFYLSSVHDKLLNRPATDGDKHAVLKELATDTCCTEEPRAPLDQYQFGPCLVFVACATVENF